MSSLVSLEPVLLADLLDAEKAPAAKGVFVREYEVNDWAANLRSSIVFALYSEDWLSMGSGELDVVTPWDPRMDGTTNAGDLEKHQLYSGYFLQAITQAIPALPLLLRAAGATLYLSRGSCAYGLPANPSELHDIPELVHLTEFLPWKTPGDEATCH
jgi:hypothetical protein